MQRSSLHERRLYRILHQHFLFPVSISRRVQSISNSRCDRHDDNSALHLDDSRSATNSRDKITIGVRSLVTKSAYRPVQTHFQTVPVSLDVVHHLVRSVRETAKSDY